MKSPRNIVFSPHVDDEVIGCFTALNRGLITDVVYFYDVDAARCDEAGKSSEMFGFRPHFDYDIADLVESISSLDTIFCPTIHDAHPQHASTNLYAKKIALETKCKLVFYTIDMTAFQEPLSAEARAMKKAALEKLFPSQHVLLRDEKYHLFEGYSENEYTISRQFKTNTHVVRLSGYNPPETLDVERQDKEDDRTFLDRLAVNLYNPRTTDKITIFNRKTRTEMTFNG